MAALSAERFLMLADTLGLAYQKLAGDAAHGDGCGDGRLAIEDDWGFSKQARLFEQTVLGFQDREASKFFNKEAADMADRAGVESIAHSFLYPLLVKLDQYCRASELPGVTNILTFASYHNTTTMGGPYNALVTPSFAAIYALCFKGASFPESSIAALVDTNANYGERTVGGEFEPGTALDANAVAGMIAPILHAEDVEFVEGAASATVQVIGQARNAAGQVSAGRVFSASITATVGGNNHVSLSASVTGDLLLSVTGIVLPAALAAGTVYVGNSLPDGREALLARN